MGFKEWQDAREAFEDELYKSLNEPVKKQTPEPSADEDDIPELEPEQPKPVSMQELLKTHHAVQTSNDGLSDDDVLAFSLEPDTFTDAAALQETEDANDERTERLYRLAEEQRSRS